MAEEERVLEKTLEVKEGRIPANYNFNLEDSFFIEDIENRHLFLNDEIDSDVVTTIVYHILRYNMEDCETPIEERQPIILYINSLGGSVSSGLSVIDAIIQSKTPVYTVNLGECCSMAFHIFIAGHKRFTMPHSEFLLHDGITGGVDSTSKMRDRLEFETNVLERAIMEIVIERTKISKATYKKQYRKEWYFMPEEAMKYGVVDYIIGNNCSIDDIL